MAIESLLVANRGEIAIRILRTAADVGIRGIAIHSEDDAGALHARRADEARALRARGAAAYLDGAAIVACAFVYSAPHLGQTGLPPPTFPPPLGDTALQNVPYVGTC